MSSSSETYQLSRTPKESERLDRQHKLFLDALGFLVHPTILKRLPNNPRIADIATGTAVILRDIAADFPDAQLDGFDISTDQFPPKEQLPPNISLHVANCKEPFPEEFHGKFDVVYLRLLIAAMLPEDWPKVSRNVFALLKPGGAIQWVDNSWSKQPYVYHDKAEVSTKGISKVFYAFFDNVADSESRLNWNLRKLPGIWSDLGMVDVEEQVYSSDRIAQDRAFGTKNIIDACTYSLESIGTLPKEELQQMHRDALQEMENGSYLRWDILCFIGFKPID